MWFSFTAELLIGSKKVKQYVGGSLEGTTTLPRLSPLRKQLKPPPPQKKKKNILFFLNNKVKVGGRVNSPSSN